MNATAYATEKQIAFATFLATERLEGEERWNAITKIATYDRQEISLYIDSLLAMPRPTSTEHSPLTGPESVGMYRVGSVFYKVQLSQAGRLYAKEVVASPTGVRFEYAPGAIRSITPDHRITMDQAKEFGMQYGACCWCGRTLTDDKSIAAGIGPVCANKI
jgi:Family of unknown function (DUF6011)